jgi:hypothetical protein
MIQILASTSPYGLGVASNQQPTTNNTMSLTLAELNNKAQEIANKLGHIEQELLLEVHALLHKSEGKCSQSPCQNQQGVSGASETPVA